VSAEPSPKRFNKIDIVAGNEFGASHKLELPHRTRRYSDAAR
jgi:hypothetical protein